MDTDGTPGYTGGHWECRCTALLGRSKLDYRPDPRRGRWRLADGNRHATRHAAGGAETGGGCVGKFHGFRARLRNSREILRHKEAFANNNKTPRRELGPATRTNFISSPTRNFCDTHSTYLMVDALTN